MNEKLEQLHQAVTALSQNAIALRQENIALKNTVAQLAAQCKQLMRQHEEERAQFWAHREEARQTLAQTAMRLREVLAALPDEDKGGSA